MRIQLCLILCLLITIGLLGGCNQEAISQEQGEQDVSDIGDKVPDNHEDKRDGDTLEVSKASVGNKNSDFAFKIFSELNKEDQDNSIFISPLSISTALTMTYQGAKDSTKEAMAKALGYSDMDIEAINANYKEVLDYLNSLDGEIELNVNNSIWVKDGKPVKEDFIDVNKEIFNAQVSSLDFSQNDAAEKINDWIARATNNKIKEMVNPPIEDDTIMYLINAIYFKGAWKKEFDKNKTTSAEFHSANGKSQDAEMMNRKDTIDYGEGEDYKAVRLPYGNEKIAMYCILPSEDTGINDFIDTLDLTKWQSIKDSIEETEDVILQLPRFEMEYGIKNLKSSLTSLGMGEAFSKDADFSGIGKNLCISDVLHKAIIEVNEKGSEAAGATIVDIRLTSISEPISFIADRPFVFIIHDEKTDSPLFIGKLYDV